MKIKWSFTCASNLFALIFPFPIQPETKEAQKKNTMQHENSHSGHKFSVTDSLEVVYRGSKTQLQVTEKSAANHSEICTGIFKLMIRRN